MKPVTAIVLLIGCAALLVLIWSYEPTVRPSDSAAAIIDNSISQEPINCDTLPQEILSDLRSLRIGKNSRFTLFSLSKDAKSSYEPVKHLDIPLPRPGMFAGSFFSQVTAACKQITPAQTSSIYRAVEVALAHLRAQVGPGERSKLIVRSDMIETVSRRALSRPGGLDATSVAVNFCGYAVSAGQGGPRGEQMAHVLEQWRTAFKDAGAVTFQPYCHSTKER